MLAGVMIWAPAGGRVWRREGQGMAASSAGWGRVGSPGGGL